MSYIYIYELSTEGISVSLPESMDTLLHPMDPAPLGRSHPGFLCLFFLQHLKDKGRFGTTILNDILRDEKKSTSKLMESIESCEVCWIHEPRLIGSLN